MSGRSRLQLQILIYIAFFLFGVPAANSAETGYDPGATVRTVAEVLEQTHLTPKPLDDQLSAAWLDQFLQRLDPRRMYFLKSDYAEFLQYQHQLDDLAKRRDFSFPKLVRARYKVRCREAAYFAEYFTSANHDFDADETYPRRHEAYAPNSGQWCERWRLRIKAELLIEKVHGTPLEEARDRLRKRYQRIARQAGQLNDEALCETFLNSLTASYGPRSHYLSESTLTHFVTGFVRTYTLGLRLRQHEGRLIISDLAYSRTTSSNRENLIGWELLGIQRINGDYYDVVEMPHCDFSNLIRWAGKPLQDDSEVILELLHPVTLERQSLSWNRTAS